VSEPAHVNKRSEKEFDVVLGSHVIGTSKSDFDARFHVNAINKALQAAYDQGFEDAELGR